MLYTLPGVPSIYYGSEFGIEGRKERHSDDSLRPALNYEDYKDAVEVNACTKLISALGKIRQNTPALCYGEYKELLLQTTHFAYARVLDSKYVITTVNNGDNQVSMNLPAGSSVEYIGALSGQKVAVVDGRLEVMIEGNSGEIWLPAEMYQDSFAPIKTVIIEKAPEVKIEAVEMVETTTEQKKAVEKSEVVKQENVDVIAEKVEKEKVVVDWSKPYEEMSVEELQEAILEKMRRNGPVTDYMLGTVRDNTHQGSLVNWVKSFH